MGEKVVIFGVGAHAANLYYCIKHESLHEVVAFTVDRSYVKEESIRGLPVVAFEDVQSVYPPGEFKMHVAIIYGRELSSKAEKYYQAKEKGYELITHISPRAITWPDMVVGDNCFIWAGSAFQPYVEIGNNVNVGPGCLICHDSKIGDHCLLSAHTVILGDVVVEPYCFFGANSTIRDGVTVARECVIGAGALILENTKERGVYKGRSAELLPKSSNMMRRGFR